METQSSVAEVSTDLWENDLEISIRPAVRLAESTTEVKRWLEPLDGVEIAALATALGESGEGKRPRQLRAALERRGRDLVPFILVNRFAKRKLKEVVVSIAEERLDKDALARCCGADGGEPSSLALLINLYALDPTRLRDVLHLDKASRPSLARMKLAKAPRQPTTNFSDWLTLERVRPIVEALGGHERAPELRGVLHHGTRHIVLIRRPDRPRFIMQRGRIEHGHRGEWIILDFSADAGRLRVASDSNREPLLIAEAIASAFFAVRVTYMNEWEISHAKQLEVILDGLKRGKYPELELLGLTVEQSPLEGADICIQKDDPVVARAAVSSFEQSFGSLTQRIDRIKKTQVLFRGRAIDLRFDLQKDADGEFIVRYTEHRLGMPLRCAFENYMSETHGINILSTETRSTTSS